MYVKLKIFTLTIICFLGINCIAKDVAEDFSGVHEEIDTSSLIDEKIEKISSTKRIFAISNTNNTYFNGDYITFVRGTKCVARGIVVKITDETAGIKIIKIYSLRYWNSLRQESEIRIFRGDDTVFCNPARHDIGDGSSKIKSEDNLFDDTILEEDNIVLEENSKRAIKQDNILGIAYGSIRCLNNDGTPAGCYQASGQWAYQVGDNMWGEISYGQSTVKDYPAPSLGTILSALSIRLKYTVSVPFYSYIQPYLGYQIVDADSPGAGKNIENDATGTLAAAELEKVESLKKRTIVFGASVLKRLVPGWFMRLNIGTDVQSFGFSLEF